MMPWTEASVRDAARAAAARESVPVIHHVLGSSSGSANPTIAVCHLVYTRPGGFMLSIPNFRDVRDSILRLDAAGVEPAFFVTAVDAVSTRGRELGSLEVGLVDLPWAVIDHFSYSDQPRGALPRGANVVQTKKDRTVAIPVRQSLLEAADAWVTSMMDPDRARDYMTGEGLEPADLAQEDGPAEESEGCELCLPGLQLWNLSCGPSRRSQCFSRPHLLL